MNFNFLIDFCKTKSDVLQHLDYISDILLKNKVVGFKNINVSDEDFGEIVINLYQGNQNTSELKPGTIYGQNHFHDKNTLDEDIENFIYGHWHVDNPFYEEVPCYTAMHMKTFKCDSSVGQTHFLDLSQMYNECPKEFLKELENTNLISATGCLEENFHKIIPHPALVVHSVSSENMIYWTGHDMRLKNNINIEWFTEFKLWVSKFVSNPNNRKTWTWNEGDILVWDNRAVAHSFSPGWTHDQRIFNRCEVGFEKLIAKKPI